MHAPQETRQASVLHGLLAGEINHGEIAEGPRVLVWRTGSINSFVSNNRLPARQGEVEMKTYWTASSPDGLSSQDICHHDNEPTAWKYCFLGAQRPLGCCFSFFLGGGGPQKYGVCKCVCYTLLLINDLGLISCWTHQSQISSTAAGVTSISREGEGYWNINITLESITHSSACVCIAHTQTHISSHPTYPFATK